MGSTDTPRLLICHQHLELLTLSDSIVTSPDGEDFSEVDLCPTFSRRPTLTFCLSPSASLHGDLVSLTSTSVLLTEPTRPRELATETLVVPWFATPPDRERTHSGPWLVSTLTFFSSLLALASLTGADKD